MSEDGNNYKRHQHRPYWEKACEDYYQRLIIGARRLANGRLSDAEDLAQEAVCRALIYSSDPAEIKNTLTYLLRIMRNAWIDKWKKENTANVESLDDLLSTGQHPMVDPDILRILENEDLQDAMTAKQEDLTPREKILLELYFKGFKCKEIADQLSEDVRLTRSDLNAVKAKVRYRLKKK
jgi:RNA polymerase sigma factor (sigma-70 family)